MSYIPKIVYNSTTIEFDLPPKGDTLGETIRAVGKVTESKSGIQQTIIDFIEKQNLITFSFLTETKKQALETFMITHGMMGKSFTYFFDKDIPGTAVTVKLHKSSFNTRPKIITRKGTGFLWEWKLKFRRVVG